LIQRTFQNIPLHYIYTEKIPLTLTFWEGSYIYLSTYIKLTTKPDPINQRSQDIIRVLLYYVLFPFLTYVLENGNRDSFSGRLHLNLTDPCELR
jgi:hypothetical protein